MTEQTTPSRAPASLDSDSARKSLNTRYGSYPPATLPEWNTTLETLLSHRSVRTYDDRGLPAGTLETLIAAAQSAPSSSNLQTWSVIAVEDPARKARLSVLAGNQHHVRAAPLLLVWLADLARLEAVAARADVQPEGLHYLETLIVGVIDAALAAQNAVVALESLGLGSVYIGAIRNAPEQVAEELALPPHVLPVFGLCVGHADSSDASQVKPRLPQSVVLHREQYEAAAQFDGISRYDALLAEFQVNRDSPRYRGRSARSNAGARGNRCMGAIACVRRFRPSASNYDRTAFTNVSLFESVRSRDLLNKI